MKEQSAQPDAIVQSLLPILKAFSSSSVAVIGCHSERISRESCEYDLLVVCEEASPCKSARVGELYVDLLFRNEKGVREATDPEFAIALSALVPLRDRSWFFASTVSSLKRKFRRNCRRATELRLAAALKSLGRVQEGLARGETENSDFWLLAAGYDFCYAVLYSHGIIPSPSHLLEQMKQVSRTGNSHFTEWADSLGLELSSRTSGENRLEGLTVLYDIMRTTQIHADLAEVLSRYRSAEAAEILRRKAKHLLESLQPVDCYAYLGLETVQSLSHLLRFHSRRESKEPNYSSIVDSLAKGKDRIIGEDVVRTLGLTRTTQMVSSAAKRLKEAVSEQARRL